MGKPHHIFLIENNREDIELIETELNNIDFDIQLQVISNKQELIDQLQNTPPLLIICDYELSDLTAFEALSIVQEKNPALPFIVVSDIIEEEKAVDIMLKGASDYIMKEKLSLLYPAVIREITNYKEYKEQFSKLKKTQTRYESLIQSVNGIVWEADADTFKFNYVSPQSEEILGYSPDEWLSKPNFWQNHIHPQDRREAINFCHSQIQKDKVHSFEYRMIDENNEVVWLRDYVTVIAEDGKPSQLRGLMVDISTEKQAEFQRNKAYEIADIGHWELDPIHEELFWSDAVKSLHGVNQDFEPDLDSALSFYQKGKHRQKIIDALEQAIETGKPFDAELKINTANNNERWVRAVGETEFHDDTCVRIFGSTQDITDRKEVEKKLRDVVEHSTNMFYRHDTNHKLSYVSPQSIDFLGYSPEEAQKKWTEFVTDHPINEKGFDHTQRAIDTGQRQPPFELQLEKKGGEIIWVLVNEAPIVENGVTVEIVGSLTDITEQKKYEEKLEELALVASKTTDVIFMTNPNERITWVNDAFEQITGYQFDEVIGKSPGNILTGPENKECTMKRISDAFKNEQPLQEIVLNYSKSGEKYWFDLTLDPIFDDEGNCEGFIAIQKDVTDQIERQRELRESVERYDIVSKATSDTIWDLNLKQDTIEYNQNIFGMFGYKKKEVEGIGQWWRDKIHPEDRQKVLNKLDDAINNGTERLQLEYRFEAADGSYKYIYDRAFVVTDKDNNATRIIGAMQDVTQQREEQKWLQLFESAVASTKESIAILEAQPSDLRGRKILYVNDAFSSMTGYPKEKAKGNTLHILNGPKTSTEERKKLSNHMDCWEPHEAELIYYKQNGEEFWIRISMTPVQGPNDTYYWVCVGRDITKRKKNENDLRESLKEKETLLLEIHHRVKNNLAVVSGMMQLQAYEAENKKFSEQLFDSVARIQTMGSIHELLYQSESFSQLNFDDNIKKLVNEIAHTFQTDFALSVNYELEPVELNINQAIPSSLIINEVITNIIKHAFDEGKNGNIIVSLSEQDQQIALTVKDNGKGLPANFNNMMTDKTLGLKLIDTLAEQLEANYSYDSLGNGTRFNLSFQKAEPKGIGSAHLF